LLILKEVLKAKTNYKQSLMLRKTTRNFSVFSKLKDFMQAPIAIAKNTSGPTGEDHGTMPTTDLDFEATAQERVAIITQNSYEVHNY
jgi:hypothetical protein